MSTPAFDPIQYKEGQRRGWHEVASGWGKWHELLEAGGRPLSERLVERAGVRPGHRLLDFTTGYGEPALTAAQRVGPEGRVVGTDIAEGMLAIARQRAERAGLDNVEFLALDAEAMDFPEQSFDSILSRNGLMFLPDPTGTLRQCHRFLIPEGKLAMSVWGAPDKVPMASIVFMAVAQAFQLPPPPADQPGVFNLGDPQRLAMVVSEAGFNDVYVEPMTVTYEFPSADAYAMWVQDVFPSPESVANASAEVKRELWENITEAAAAYAAPDGRVRLENETLCVVGTK